MAPIAQKASANAERGANSVSRWVEANRNLAIAVGVGTIVVGGAGAYYYLNGDSRSARSRGMSKGGDEKTDNSDKAPSGGSGAAATAKKRKNKKSKKSKDGGAGASTDTPPYNTDGPLLDDASEQDLMALPEDQIKRLPEEVSIFVR